MNVMAPFWARRRAEVGILDIPGELTHAYAMDLINLVEHWYRSGKTIVLIIRMNSAGGSIVAAQHLAEFFRAFQKDGLKIVVVCGDLVQSAALYIAVVADHLLAPPSTVLGAVGGSITRREFEPSDQIGRWRLSTISSGHLKDDRANHADGPHEGRLMLQQIVDDVSDQFCDWLLTRRQLDQDVIESLRYGRSLVAVRALEYRLIDGLGGHTAALQAAAEYCGHSDFQRSFLKLPPDERLVDRVWNWMVNSLAKGVLG